MINELQIQQARRRLLRRVEETDLKGEAALLLSGGVDSATTLFAMLEAGRRPRCYTFHLAGQNSTDLLVAQRMCAHFALEHTAIAVPTSLEILAQDVRRVLSLVDWRRVSRLKKTIVQCVHPFLYLYPAIKEKLLLCGLGGDSFFLTDRKSQVTLHREGEEAVRWQRQSWFHDPEYSDYHIADIGARCYGKTLIDFYDFSWLAAWFQQFTHAELHRPKVKSAAVRWFLDYWRQGNWYREPSAFQINSGLREVHDSLLRQPGERARAVIAIYYRLAREMRLAFGTEKYARSESGQMLKPDQVAAIGAPTTQDWQEVSDYE